MATPPGDPAKQGGPVMERSPSGSGPSPGAPGRSTRQGSSVDRRKGIASVASVRRDRDSDDDSGTRGGETRDSDDDSGVGVDRLNPCTLEFQASETLEGFHRDYRANQSWRQKIVLLCFGVCNFLFLGIMLSPSDEILTFSMFMVACGLMLILGVWCSKHHFERQQVFCCVLLWLGILTGTIRDIWGNQFFPDSRNHGFDITAMLCILAIPCLDLRFTLAVFTTSVSALTYFLPRVLPAVRETYMAVEPVELVQQCGVFTEVVLVTLIATYELERRSRMLSAALWKREMAGARSGNRSHLQAIARLIALRGKSSHQFLLDDVEVGQSRNSVLAAARDEQGGGQHHTGSGAGGGQDRRRGVFASQAAAVAGPAKQHAQAARRESRVSVDLLEKLRALSAEQEGKELQSRSFWCCCSRLRDGITPMLLPHTMESVYQVVDHAEGVRTFTFNLSRILALECLTGLFDILEDNMPLLMAVRYGFILPMCVAAIVAVRVSAPGSLIRRHIFAFTDAVLFLNLVGFMLIMLVPTWGVVDFASATAKVCCGFVMIMNDCRLPLTHAVGTAFSGLVLYVLWIHAIPRRWSNTPAELQSVYAIRLYQPIVFTLVIGFWSARQAEISRREKFIIDIGDTQKTRISWTSEDRTLQAGCA